ncbi:MAG: hypothetical protein GY725_12685 [bacterium]|nr:hypothetical protein [bacterium]
MTTQKNSLVIAGLAMILLVGGGSHLAFANGTGGGIQGSPHDFTDDVDQGGATVSEITGAIPWNLKRKEICRTCHVPHDHGKVRYGNQGILWNHEVTTKTTWQMYGTDASMIDYMDATPATEPLGVSKLCLGCHDGVTGINQYDGKVAADFPNVDYGGALQVLSDQYSAGFVIGGATTNVGDCLTNGNCADYGASSMTNNHPISIAYADAGGAAKGMKPDTTPLGGGTIADVLDNGRVECSTCHDVHDKDAVSGTHLLRESTKAGVGAGASALCLTCHDK